MNEFNDINEAKGFIAASLEGKCDDPVAREALTDALADVFEVDEDGAEPVSNCTRLFLKRARWVIRDDDLKLFDNLVKAVSTIITAGVILTGEMQTKDIISLVSLACALVYSVVRKGARLTEEQCRVLVALKAHAHAVSEDDLALELGVPVEEATGLLTQLKAIRLADGSVAALVAQDGDKLWQAAGV